MTHRCYLLGLCLLLSGCAEYQFTVNDKVVYEPPPLFSDYQTGDQALQACLEQHIRDANATSAAGLTQLNCSHAGVRSLQGIEVFSGLQSIKLASNAITDIGPLSTLAELKRLHLEGNAIRSLLPLRGLEQLEFLDLTGNAALVCAELDYFRRLSALELLPPAHCGA